MSQQNSENKKSATIYEGLLFLSMCALVTGIIFLILKLNEYNWDMGN
ncbi:hypothetical protein Pla110_08870 [Polystyrenella longa]|uniref:Uncharacterized protein n=1 Tax=Polystyrenella longa TaxID=2528007 RepID=A0A518CIX9_9PLAN|nr:hypothetical protein [Polystyrenella longa]QDU79182.1 hypothetical protein Pla110_08870 [Polystyrenella longa]